jgi:hypothetical protein
MSLLDASSDSGWKERDPDIEDMYVVYRGSQEERSILWEVAVSVILRKKVYTYMNTCPIPNGFLYLARNIFLTPSL